jgi:hypothetical protein
MENLSDPDKIHNTVKDLIKTSNQELLVTYPQSTPSIDMKGRA